MLHNFNRNSFRNIVSIITRLSSGRVKGSRKIVKYFSENGQTQNLGLFPNDFKKLNARKDLGIYVADAEAANKIASSICRFQKKDVPFFEINPGPCILTRALISQLEFKMLGLTEKNELFSDVQLVRGWAPILLAQIVRIEELFLFCQLINRNIYVTFFS